ncbi:MAG: hypothetical protein HZC12_08900, partial [Nitrospirae bacterium]|nr:hypothetical protein [Nitrospirota bacterium]
RVEWVKMINYLASQYTAEEVWKRFRIGKSSLVGAIGGFAIGHLLGYIGTRNDSVNWRIAEYLLIAWIIAKVCVEVKNVFLPSRKYNIELVLKGAEKFRKAKESKIKK